MSEIDVEGILERLEPSGDDCPFCHRDPYHYVDIGVGMERAAVNCCDLGNSLIQYQDEQLAAIVQLHRDAAAIIRELTASRDRASDACATVQRERDEAREEVERLRKLVAPQWFYYGDECSSDRCRDSIHECIDEDFLYDNRGEGAHVLEIATATNLPTIWAAVRFFTDDEKDERQSDDDYEVTEFATEAEAQAFLARYEASK